MNTGNGSFRERDFSRNDNNEKSPSTRQEEETNIEKNAKESAIGWSVILAACLAIILAVTTYILEPILPTLYLRYLQIAEVCGRLLCNTYNQ